MAKQTQTEKVTRGSGNVFRDLEFKDADERLAKARLVVAISRVMSQTNTTQAKMAKIIGLDQPSVSKLLRGRTSGYSADRLMKILNQLGQDVEITVRPKKSKSGTTGQLLVVVPPIESENVLAARVSAKSAMVQAVKEPKAAYLKKPIRKKK